MKGQPINPKNRKKTHQGTSEGNYRKRGQKEKVGHSGISFKKEFRDREGGEGAG